MNITPRSSHGKPFYKPLPAPGNDFVFGIHSVIESIEAGKEIEKVLLRPGLTGELAATLQTLIKERKLVHQFVPLEKLNRITRKNHQGVIAFLSPIEYQDIGHIIPQLFEQGKEPLIVLLDGITDVRNIGAIARSAECAGAHALIVPEKGSAQINADAIKTSAGALQHLSVCRVPDIRQTLNFLRNCGLNIVAATEKGTDDHFHSNLKGPLVLVLGSEDTGISEECLRLCDQGIRIPVLGRIQSLNVSAAASVILYEILRQRLS